MKCPIRILSESTPPELYKLIVNLSERTKKQKELKLPKRKEQIGDRMGGL